MNPIVQAADLAIEYATARARVRALDGADLTVSPGASLGLVGESGSGKTTLGMAMGRLLPSSSACVAGTLHVDGRSIFDLDDDGLRRLRRAKLGFVFQNPMSALNPTARIDVQVAHALGRNKPDDEVRDLLMRVGLADENRIIKAYPHQLSGGMAQRVVVAMAIARRPALLIADEPTASLDASIRGQILELLNSLRHQGGMALVLLSHELAVVARHCETIGVMYGGRVVESGPSNEVLGNPTHPYTRALLRAAPGQEKLGERLNPIPGTPPVLTGPSQGCSFAPRCPLQTSQCRQERPTARRIAGRTTLCHRAEEVRLMPLAHQGARDWT
jgi:oligopeptide/dipeptide ABC transporter ATP-binding protein